MKDLTIALTNRPGALADMGEALGRAGVSVEGGGAWIQDSKAIGHFLFEDGAAAREALTAAGIAVIKDQEILMQRLNQGEPGQLGKLARRMAEAGVNIETLYSDHEHRLILVVDDPLKGDLVSQAWERDRTAKLNAHKSHSYRLNLLWTGNDGRGTQTYRSYRRDFSVAGKDKPEILGSSDPTFRGDPQRYNPEEMLVASLSSCHMLTYLYLCSINGVSVLEYTDQPTGIMREDAQGSGQFESVTLHPTVTVSEHHMLDAADALHHQAHSMCFIARSVNFSVEVQPSATCSKVP